MHIFPTIHEDVEIAPLEPPAVLDRIHEITVEIATEEFSHGKIFVGMFFGFMFTLTHISCLHAIKGGDIIIVTGYFSPDQKRLQLDYLLSKTGKVLLAGVSLLLPLLSLLILLLAGKYTGVGSLPTYVLFYSLWAVLVYVVGYICFHLRMTKIHKILQIQVLY